MEVEDSYEGAVRRLQRLENAGIRIEPAAFERRDDERETLRARIADLEELASLACDENERLERELVEAHDQVASLKRLMATLAEGAESAAAPAPAPRTSARAAWPPVVAAQSPWPPAVEAAAHAPVADAAPVWPVEAAAPSPSSESDLDVDLSLSSSKGKRLPLVVGLLVAGGIAVALVALRPWATPQNVAAAAAFAQAPIAPVAVAPVAVAPVAVTPVAVTPVVAPVTVAVAHVTPPAAAVVIPTAAAVVIPTAKPQHGAAAPAPRSHAAVKRRAQKRERHASSKRHSASHAVSSLRDSTNTTDPLGGLNL